MTKYLQLWMYGPVQCLLERGTDTDPIRHFRTDSLTEIV
jgi:hypothetical protein